MGKSSSPDVSGIKVSVDTVTNGVADDSPIVIGHVDSIGTVIDKSRNTQKYTPVNDTQYDEIVALGSLSQGAFSMAVLYDPEASEGVNVLETAIDDNTEVQIIIEFNNSLGVNGTTIKQIAKVSSFKVDGEKDGLYKASYNAERIGAAAVTAAA